MLGVITSFWIYIVYLPLHSAIFLGDELFYKEAFIMQVLIHSNPYPRRVIHLLSNELFVVRRALWSLIILNMKVYREVFMAAISVL